MCGQGLARNHTMNNGPRLDSSFDFCHFFFFFCASIFTCHPTERGFNTSLKPECFSSVQSDPSQQLLDTSPNNKEGKAGSN